MEETPEIPKASRKPIRTELIVAFAAIIISVATLSVYIYQARIMQEQQHVSVWPYIEWTVTVSSQDGFYISVVNKGVGPAIIKSAKMAFDSDVMEPRNLLQKIVGSRKLDSLFLSIETVEGRVLAPGEEVRPFHIAVRSIEEYYSIQRKLDGVSSKLSFEICYCSIYGDCWTSLGLEVTESTCP